MKIQYLMAGCLAASLTFFGCGDDSSSNSGSGVDREDVSSSSGDDDISSSSTKKESSSSKGVKSEFRTATLDDLSKNMILEIDGHEVHLSTGVKQGLFTFWVLGKGADPDTGRVVVFSDFEDGVISLNKDNSAPAVINTLDTDYFLYKMAKGKKVAFFVDTTETLLYSVDDGKKQEAQKEQVAVSKTTINKMEEMVGKSITCKSGDTTEVYKFFNGRYVVNRTVGEKETFAGGIADIQRGTLFLKPEIYLGPVMQLYMLTVSTDYDLGLGECSAKDFDFTEIKVEDLAGDWYALNKEEKVNWNLALNKDKTFDLRANGGDVSLRQGVWDVYGNELFMDVNACNDPESCEGAIGGALEKFKKGEGFTFKHGNKESPALPTEWTVPELE